MNRRLLAFQIFLLHAHVAGKTYSCTMHHSVHCITDKREGLSVISQTDCLAHQTPEQQGQ